MDALSYVHLFNTGIFSHSSQLCEEIDDLGRNAGTDENQPSQTPKGSELYSALFSSIKTIVSSRNIGNVKPIYPDQCHSLIYAFSFKSSIFRIQERIAGKQYESF
jgi:hypothetical protein